jgi:hypothetical protein
MGFDPRAAVGEALRSGVGTGQRRSAEPVVDPEPVASTGPVAAPATATRRRLRSVAGSAGGSVPVVDPPAARVPKAQASAAAGAVEPVGVRRGGRRVLDLNLGRDARAVLAADTTGRTKGDIVLEAIEASYEQVVAAHGRERTGLFAAAGRSPERRRVGDPRKVAVTVSEAEAEILAGVLAQTTLSLSAFVDEALRRGGGRTT